MLGSFEKAGDNPRAELLRLWVFRRLVRCVGFRGGRSSLLPTWRRRGWSSDVG